MRHPGYCGFFLFALGGQFLLGNFVSLIVFAFVLWIFFVIRIHYEELFLQKIFPLAWTSYSQQVTFTGIPFQQIAFPIISRFISIRMKEMMIA